MIIVYGKNSNDITILHKYEQLLKLGLTNVHIYTGGIFEWMLLHEIYGKDLFKITKYEIDILRYRPKSVLLTEMSGGASGRAAIEDDGELYIENSTTNTVNVSNPDYRVNISDDNDTSNGGILTSGIRWLFGT
jgi:hypothetical protein